MVIVRPRIIVLDSATLGNAARDYWSADSSAKAKARTFVAELRDQGVFVTLTFTQITELLGHADQNVVNARLAFMHDLPLIGWLRPYDRSWFPGTFVDLLTRELHAVAHDSACGWGEVVRRVRADLWETGNGAEIFVENDELWSRLRQETMAHQKKTQFIASMARTDPGGIRDLTVCDALRLPIRPREERPAYMARFASDLRDQLKRHGDKRLDCAEKAARDLATDSLQAVEALDVETPVTAMAVLASCGLDPEFVRPDMTIGEVGELAVYADQLRIVSRPLRPPLNLTMRDVPLDTLPSQALQRKLTLIQRRASRVSGSDLGDSHIAPLLLYADIVQVDRRTAEFLRQLARNEPELAELMGRFFPLADYGRLTEELEAQ